MNSLDESFKDHAQHENSKFVETDPDFEKI